MSLKLEAKYEASDGTIFDEMDEWILYQEGLDKIPNIRVIGIDRKYHVAAPYKDTCLCGIKILTKNLHTEGMRYSCYECTY